MTEITEYCIFGERCTGTNYLNKLMEKNFNLKKTEKYGFKHFFGFHSLENSDNCLFIGIVRDPFQWLGSLNKKQYHFPHHLKKRNYKILLQNEFFSVYDSARDHGDKFGKEIMEDRHIYLKRRYKNIIELRNTKNYFLVHDMPKKVKHYILIRYEDISNNTFEELQKIQDTFHLERKNPEFVNFEKHTKIKGTKWENNHETYIPHPLNFKIVLSKIDLHLEHQLNYLNQFKFKNKN